jgi:hypothetical protein
VRSILASLVLAPPNWHQATVHFAATGNAGGTNSDGGAKAVGAQRAWSLLLGGALMVVGQCLAAVGVFVGTINQSCASSDQCQAGSYCHVGGSNRCLFCGSDAPLPGTDNGSPTQRRGHSAPASTTKRCLLMCALHPLSTSHGQEIPFLPQPLRRGARPVCMASTTQSTK